MIHFKNFRKYIHASVIALVGMLIFIGCKKTENKDEPPFNTANSLTLFKPGNSKADLTLSDTILTQAGLVNKFVPVSGSTGATSGLKFIKIDIRLSSNDSLLNTKTISTFFRKDYHVMTNVPIDIPRSQRGKVYKVTVTTTDIANAEVGKKSFYALDVLLCSPEPSCVVSNQITFLVETPSTTLPTDNIYIFGGFNGWSNTATDYKLTPSTDLPNCYCISMPFAPGAQAWQIGEIFITRGSFASNALLPNGNTQIENYNAGPLEPLFKIKVTKWRDR
jgi:hypothetical protein